MKELILAVLTWPTVGQNTGGFYFGPAAEKTGGECTDNKGQSIPEGLLFSPGPDECQVCTCLRQLPVLCRTVLCAPPKNCVSLRVGPACCQWICDDTASDIGLRLVGSAVTAILSLSLLFFLIYRLRQRRLRGRQNHLQAESLNSVTGGGGDECWIGDTQLNNGGYDWRKAEGPLNRPFPPTYDEAVAAAPPYPPLDQPVPYQVATLGRRVLPPLGTVGTTLPSVLRRMRQGEEAGNQMPAPHHIQVPVRQMNPLFRHSLQHHHTQDSGLDGAGSDDDLGWTEAQQPPTVSATVVPGRRRRATDAADESSRVVETASIERDAAGLSSSRLGASSADSSSRFHGRRRQGREGSSARESDEGDDEVPGVGAVLHGGHAAFYRACVGPPAADEPMDDEDGCLHKDQRCFPSREDVSTEATPAESTRSDTRQTSRLKSTQEINLTYAV